MPNDLHCQSQLSNGNLSTGKVEFPWPGQALNCLSHSILFVVLTMHYHRYCLYYLLPALVNIFNSCLKRSAFHNADWISLLVHLRDCTLTVVPCICSLTSFAEWIEKMVLKICEIFCIFVDMEVFTFQQTPSRALFGRREHVIKVCYCLSSTLMF